MTDNLKARDASASKHVFDDVVEDEGGPKVEDEGGPKVEDEGGPKVVPNESGDVPCRQDSKQG